MVRHHTMRDTDMKAHAEESHDAHPGEAHVAMIESSHQSADHDTHGDDEHAEEAHDYPGEAHAAMIESTHESDDVHAERGHRRMRSTVTIHMLSMVMMRMQNMPHIKLQIDHGLQST